jgi:hypothetical protein
MPLPINLKNYVFSSKDAKIDKKYSVVIRLSVGNSIGPGTKNKMIVQTLLQFPFNMADLTEAIDSELEDCQKSRTKDNLNTPIPFLVRKKAQLLTYECGFDGEYDSENDVEDVIATSGQCKTLELKELRNDDDLKKALSQVSVKLSKLPAEKSGTVKAQRLALSRLRKVADTLILDVVVSVTNPKKRKVSTDGDASADGASGSNDNKKARGQNVATHLKICIGYPVHQESATSNTLIVDKTEDHFSFYLPVSKITSLSELRFHALQHIFSRIPDLLKQISEHSKLYHRSSKRSKEISPAHEISSSTNCMDILKELLVVKMPRVSTDEEDAEATYSKELPISFGLSLDPSSFITVQYLHHLVRNLLISDEDLTLKLLNSVNNHQRDYSRFFSFCFVFLTNLLQIFKGTLDEDNEFEKNHPEFDFPFSQQQKEEPPFIPSKKDVAKESTTKIPTIRRLLMELQMNPSSPLYHAMTNKLEIAMVDYLAHHVLGLNAVKPFLINNFSFKDGPVVLPVNFIPDLNDPLWKKQLCNIPPFGFVRNAYPLGTDGKYMIHPADTSGPDSKNPLAGLTDALVGFLGAKSASSSAPAPTVTAPTVTTGDQKNVYFTRQQSNIMDGLSVPISSDLSYLWEYFLKMKKIGDQVCFIIAKKPTLGKQIVFRIELTAEGKFMMIPLEQSKIFSMSQLLEGLSVKKPLFIDIYEIDDLVKEDLTALTASDCF